MNKKLRQQAIQEIILAFAVSSQEELADYLRERDIEVTQATLSRDLAEMSVMRVRTGDKFRYALRSDETERSLKSLVWKEIVSAESNETVVIIRTLPGRASGVAMFIDSLRNPSVLATIAGDDTVLVIPSSIKKIQTTIRFVRDLLSEKQ
ncbi:MAG TPA: arginine repressor [Bacteroidota bacterium]|nr:arginine repressor [Bacteroidota bacterium]